MVQAVLQRSAWLQCLVQEALALLQQSTQHSLDPSSKDEQRWPQQCIQWPPIEIVRGRYRCYSLWCYVTDFSRFYLYASMSWGFFSIFLTWCAFLGGQAFPGSYGKTRSCHAGCGWGNLWCKEDISHCFFYWDKKMAVLSTYVGQGQSMLGEVKLQ